MADEDFSYISCWSWEENKLFEIALALIHEDKPNRWKEIASMIGGERSVEEVKKHYEKLLEDLDMIESGILDQDSVEVQVCNQCSAWTDDDQKSLTEFENRRRPSFQPTMPLHQQDLGFQPCSINLHITRPPSSEECNISLPDQVKQNSKTGH